MVDCREEEQVVLVDEDGRERIAADGSTLTAGKMDAHTQGLRHRAVSVFVFNGRGEILLQRRALSKYHSGGLWSNTCCTHPRPGESPLEAGERRLQEEMGISCRLEQSFVFSYWAAVGSGLIENEFDHVCRAWYEGDPKPEPAEVAEWKWIDLESLRADLEAEPRHYTMWLRICLERVLQAASVTGQERSSAGAR